MSTGRGPADRSWLVPAGVAVALRPRLWGTAARQVAALAEPGWWRRPPRLPLPAPGYLGFRLVTAYGDAAARPEAADVVAYLAWCRAQPRRSGRHADSRRHRPVGAGAGR